jgi:predicted PurR-regulated permease PerM
MVMQLLDNFILQPNIFSKSVKAHPLEIFIVVLMGAKIGGILGMVVAIPIYTVLRVLAKVFLSEFKVVQSITKGI